MVLFREKNRKLYRFIAIFYVVAVAYVMILAVAQKYLDIGYRTFDWPIMMVSVLANYTLKALFIFPIVLFTAEYLFDRQSLIRGIMTHILFSVVFAIYNAFCLFYMESLLLGSGEKISMDILVNRTMGGASFTFFLYFSVISIVYAALYLFKQQDQEIGQERLKTKLLDAKMEALKAQIHPHFLFNSLNNISALAQIEPKKSQDAIADLSDLLRATLAIQDKKFIPLSQEMDIAKRYLRLMGLRYDEKLSYRIDNAVQDERIMVPPFLFQPILENSIKHGFGESVDRLEVLVSIDQSSGFLKLQFKNNGKPLADGPILFGTGISNILSRLKELFSEDGYEFQIKNEDGHVITEVSIPLIGVSVKTD